MNADHYIERAPSPLPERAGREDIVIWRAVFGNRVLAMRLAAESGELLEHRFGVPMEVVDEAMGMVGA